MADFLTLAATLTRRASIALYRAAEGPSLTASQHVNDAVRYLREAERLGDPSVSGWRQRAEQIQAVYPNGLQLLDELSAEMFWAAANEPRYAMKWRAA